jgi:ribosome-binding protein aMBF1 (putative translation factor)
MIRHEHSYRRARKKLTEERARLDELIRSLKEEGLGEDAIARTTGSMARDVDALAEQIEAYERAREGEFGEIVNLEGIGELLVQARIARDINQSELARLLEVDPSQVSKDERLRYKGVTLERAQRVLAALEVTVVSTVRQDPAPAPEEE